MRRIAIILSGPGGTGIPACPSGDRQECLSYPAIMHMATRACLVMLLALLAAASPARAQDGGGGFYRVLAAKPNATFDDAVRAFHEVVTDEPASADAPFEPLAQTLVARKVIRSDWIGQPQAKLTRGRAAYMLYQALRLRGGLTLSVLGPSERYCLRECLFLGVWPSGTPRDLMTGGELMGVLKWAADYQEEHGKKPPPSAPPEGEAKPGEKADEKPAPAAPAELPGRYVVQRGDTLAGISRRFYGTADRWQDIVRENALNPPLIRVGQTLVIPK